MNFKNNRESVNPLYKQTKVIPLEFNIILNQGKFFWKYTHDILPKCCNEILNNFGILPYGRENSSLKLHTPIQRTDIGKKFIC